MLYKFKSKATGDLIMLEPQGKHILKLIGKSPDAKGIILPHEMLAAIEALHAAVAQEEQALKAAIEATNPSVDMDVQADAAASGAHGPRSISLKQRVVPFIDMLRRAHAEDKEVVWGV
jgi:cyclopropane-fatty-acyl-phospholipid synthase